MKDKIYFQLTLFRDNSWVKGILLDFIDFMRYEWFWDERKHIEK